MVTHIGRDLRAIRERRGWARETLAHHAGVSWGAVAQIEAGRRPDPRLSTVVALADALGIALDQLVGRTVPTAGFQHRALIYGSDAEFENAIVPYVTEGLEQSDAVLVVTPRARMKRLRRAMGGDAARVSFRESAAWYSSPQAALDRYRKYLQERVGEGSPWVRVVGEPVWAGRTTREIRTWSRYESMLNVSFAGSPATIVCPYDTDSLPAGILAEARCNHPEVTSAGTSATSDTYRSPEAFLLGS